MNKNLESTSVNKIVIVGASCFLAGLFTGALAVVFVKAGSSPTIASIVPAFIPLPMAQNPYPGCTLAPIPNDIKPEDAAVIRNFLKRESDTGKWEEVEWNRVDPSEGKEIWFQNEGISDTDYCVSLKYRTQNKLGAVTIYHVRGLFYASGKITILGGPLQYAETATIRNEIKNRPPSKQLIGPRNDAERAVEMFDDLFKDKPKPAGKQRQ